VYQFLHCRRLIAFLLLGIGAVLAFATCVAPVLFTHPELLSRFSRSAGSSSFPYPLPWQPGFQINFFWSRIQYCFNHYFMVGANLIFCLFFSATFVFLLRNRAGRFIHPFQLSSLIFAFLAPLLWALQPYYLWFAVLPLVVFLLENQLNENCPHRNLALVGVFLAFSPLIFHESKATFSVISRPKQESSGYVREQLLKLIKPEERVAVSFDQFFTLRNYREVAEVNFVCRGLDRFDFVYVTRIWSSKQGHPAAVPIPCSEVSETRCFEPVENLATNTPLYFAGWNTGYVARGFGGTLYKNTRCIDSIDRQVLKSTPQISWLNTELRKK
jgi:hypothetical protein